MSRYRLTITWPDGRVTRDVVTKDTLRRFRLPACGGASVKWEKVR